MTGKRALLGLLLLVSAVCAAHAATANECLLAVSRSPTHTNTKCAELCVGSPISPGPEFTRNCLLPSEAMECHVTRRLGRSPTKFLEFLGDEVHVDLGKVVLAETARDCQTECQTDESCYYFQFDKEVNNGVTNDVDKKPNCFLSTRLYVDSVLRLAPTAEDSAFCDGLCTGEGHDCTTCVAEAPADNEGDDEPEEDLRCVSSADELTIISGPKTCEVNPPVEGCDIFHCDDFLATSSLTSNKGCQTTCRNTGFTHEDFTSTCQLGASIDKCFVPTVFGRTAAEFLQISEGNPNLALGTVISTAATAAQCQTECQASDVCVWFNFDDGKCLLATQEYLRQILAGSPIIVDSLLCPKSCDDENKDAFCSTCGDPPNDMYICVRTESETVSGPRHCATEIAPTVCETPVPDCDALVAFKEGGQNSACRMDCLSGNVREDCGSADECFGTRSIGRAAKSFNDFVAQLGADAELDPATYGSVIKEVSSAVACQTECQKETTCAWFSYDETDKLCLLAKQDYVSHVLNNPIDSLEDGQTETENYSSLFCSVDKCLDEESEFCSRCGDPEVNLCDISKGSDISGPYSCARETREVCHYPVGEASTTTSTTTTIPGTTTTTVSGALDLLPRLGLTVGVVAAAAMLIA